MKLITMFFFSVFMFFFYGCGCKHYTITSAKDPVLTHIGEHIFELCKNVRISVGLPKYEEDFRGAYKLPNDSIVIGNIAGIGFYGEKEGIIVGKGSEFEVGKCKFRVLEVEPRQLYDSVTHDIWGESITLQTIAYPKFCPCQNAQLRKYERRQQERREHEKK